MGQRISFTCISCNKQLEADAEPAGRKVRCPGCRNLMLIQKSDTEARLKIVMQEKDQRRNEMLDYNRRLDRTIVLYLSAAYGAIGLETAGKLDLAPLRTQDHYVWIAFAFIFLNVCILLHGISQSAWCMALAKFIHIKLEGELLHLAGAQVSGDSKANGNNGGQTASGAPTDAKNNHVAADELDAVDSVRFDDWEKEVKGVANATRGLVTPLWMLLLLASSVCSLMFVNVPRFLQAYWEKDFPVSYLPFCAMAFLVLLHLIAFLHLIRLGFCVGQYHDSQVSFSFVKGMMVWVLALALTAFVVGASYLAIENHQ